MLWTDAPLTTMRMGWSFLKGLSFAYPHICFYSIPLFDIWRWYGLRQSIVRKSFLRRSVVSLSGFIRCKHVCIQRVRLSLSTPFHVTVMPHFLDQTLSDWLDVFSKISNASSVLELHDNTTQEPCVVMSDDHDFFEMQKQLSSDLRFIYIENSSFLLSKFLLEK